LLLRRHHHRHPPSAVDIPCSFPVAHRTATSLGAHPVPSIASYPYVNKASSPALAFDSNTQAQRSCGEPQYLASDTIPSPTPPLLSPRPLSPNIASPPLFSLAPGHHALLWAGTHYRPRGYWHPSLLRSPQEAAAFRQDGCVHVERRER